MAPTSKGRALTAGASRRRLSPAPPAEAGELGQAKARLALVIGEARRGRMTVEELAVRAGVSSGIISQIERGFGNPSYSTLLKIAHALDLPLASFFSEPDGDAMLVRPERRKKLVLPDGLTYELLTPDFQRQLAVFRTTVPPGFDNSDFPSTHPGEECVYVISGQISFRTGSKSFLLTAGDSLTHDSGIAHSLINQSAHPAELIISVTPVTF
jgi:transcriptional regulator with XRE-family HTH domain